MLSVLILLVMAVQDFRTYKVNDQYQIALLLSVYFEFDPGVIRIALTLLLFAVFTKLAKYVENYIGGADLKLIAIIYLGAGLQILPILIVASICGMIFGLIRKQKRIPFVPFLWLGVTIVAF